MAKLFLKVIEKEKAEGTYRKTRLRHQKWNNNKQGELSG